MKTTETTERVPHLRELREACRAFADDPTPAKRTRIRLLLDAYEYWVKHSTDRLLAEIAEHQR